MMVKRSIKILALASVFLSACTVKWVADYDADLAASVQQVAKTTDAFYLNMLESSSRSDSTRNYSYFAPGYATIEAELNSIRLQNQIKALNEHSTRISEIAIEMWVDYKTEHKTDGTISDGIIKLNRVYMQDVYRAMLIAEEGKNFTKPE